MAILNKIVAEKLHKILQEFHAQDLEIGLHSRPSDHLVECKFCITTPNQKWKLQLIAENSNSWSRLPTVRLIHAGLPAMDHIGSDGVICISDHQGEVFEPKNIAGIMRFSLEKALEILDHSWSSLQQGQRIDLIDELEGYIQTVDGVLPHDYSPLLHIDPTLGNPIYAWIKTSAKAPSIFLVQHLAGDQDVPKFQHANLTKVRIQTILMPSANNFPIPHQGGTFDVDWLNQFWQNCVGTQLATIQKKGRHIVLVGIPNKHGYAYLLVSYYVTNPRSVIPVTNLRVQTLQRAWREYLLQRTGQQAQPRCVAIVGCGSVGSQVADFLAKSGIDKLMLVDHERLSADNIYRHILGTSAVGQFKVEALAEHLRRERPGLDVVSATMPASLFFEKFNADEFDTIILATGHVPTERLIYRKLYCREKPLQVVSGWVEALGLGGHVISSILPQAGCLDCLYHDQHHDPCLINKVGYIVGNQKIARNITGCAGAFTPFSSLDASKTALLICEFVLNPRRGLISWTGTSKLADQLSVQRLPTWDTVHQAGGQRFQSTADFLALGCSCCCI